MFALEKKKKKECSIPRAAARPLPGYESLENYYHMKDQLLWNLYAILFITQEPLFLFWQHDLMIFFYFDL